LRKKNIDFLKYLPKQNSFYDQRKSAVCERFRNFYFFERVLIPLFEVVLNNLKIYKFLPICRSNNNRFWCHIHSIYIQLELEIIILALYQKLARGVIDNFTFLRDGNLMHPLEGSFYLKTFNGVVTLSIKFTQIHKLQ
jgi:hypothetical protein